MAKMIKMFRPGTHVAKDGSVHTITEADLRASAAAYNPELHAAPMVIGHPKFEDPKYGTIQRVEFAEGFYKGEPAKVDPQFAQMVNDGRYDRVSTSWYSPTSPSNPVPGVYYPRHLGFLGASPPGCKGLGAVSFADGEEGLIEFAEEEGDAKQAQEARAKRYGIGVKEGGHVTKPGDAADLADSMFGDPVNYRYPLDDSRIHAALSYWAQAKNREQYTEAEIKTVTRRIVAAAKKAGVEVDKDKFDFGDYDDLLIVRMFRSLRDAWIEKFGKDEADKVFDRYDLDVLQTDALTSDKPGHCGTCGMPCAECGCNNGNSTTDFGESSSKGGAMALTEQQLKDKEKELNEREKNLNKQASDRKHAENVSFAEGLVKDGKLRAAQKDQMIALLDFCEGVTTGETIEFGEGDGKKTVSPASVLKGMLSASPKLINFGEYEFGEDPGSQNRGEIPADITKFV